MSKRFFNPPPHTSRLSQRQKQTKRCHNNRAYSKQIAHQSQQIKMMAQNQAEIMHINDLLAQTEILRHTESLSRLTRFYLYFFFLIYVANRIPRVEAAQCYTSGAFHTDCNQLPKGACLVIGGLKLPEDKQLNFPGINVALGSTLLSESDHLIPLYGRAKCFFYRAPSTDFWWKNPNVPTDITLEANSVAIYGNIHLKNWTIKTKYSESIGCFAGQQMLAWHDYNADNIRAESCSFVRIPLNGDAPRSQSRSERQTPSEVSGSILIGPHAHLTAEKTYFEAGAHFFNHGKVTFSDTYRFHVKGHLIQPFPSHTLLFNYPIDSPLDIDIHVEGDIKGSGNIIAEAKLQSP